MAWLTTNGSTIAEAAGKAALMYGVAVLGLRFAPRRTLAQWTAIDFAAAVAVGAIIGRTALASNQSFEAGAVALLTILAAHLLVTIARYDPRLAKLTDHRVRVLLVDGELRRDQLKLCGLTENDVFSKLRERGVRRLEDLRYVIYETKGDLTIVGDEDCLAGTGLVAGALESAAGYPDGS